jgi:hypothetical protein
MKARSVVAGVFASVAMVIGGAGGASANIAWCGGDPPVRVDTQTGANVTVNTTVSVVQSEVKLLNEVHADAVMTADGRGGTDIAVNVHLPAGISTANVAAAVKRYHVSASAAGQGGSTVTLYLHVPVA